MYRKIMVPLDGSRLAEGAVATAADIAKRSGAALHLARVVSWTSELTDMSTPRAPRRYMNRIAEDIVASHQLDARVDLLSDAINGVGYGEPPRRAIAEVLREHAIRNGIDLTVMTTHGRGGLKRVWLGSVADSLLRLSNGNVLMLKAARRKSSMEPIMAERILVPVDVATKDEEVVARAVELGELYNAEYTLVHVASPAIPFAGVTAGELMDGGLVTSDFAQSYLDRMARVLVDSGHSVRTKVLTAPFIAPEVLSFAEDHQFDMMVVASHGPTSIQRLMLGSVADKLIRGCAIPVLACNVSMR